MKTLLLIISLLIIVFSCKQSNNSHVTDTNITNVSSSFDDLNMNCEEGIQKANHDLSEGKLGYFRFGERTVAQISDSLLEKEYGFKIYSRGCQYAEGWICYDSIMKLHIHKKFGVDVILAAFLKANEIEFTRETGLIVSELPIIDFSKRSAQNTIACFLQFDTTFKHGQNVDTIRKIIKNLLFINSRLQGNEELNLKFDTSGFVVDIYSKSPIEASLKGKILKKISKIGSAMTFCIYGRKKPFIFPYEIK